MPFVFNLQTVSTACRRSSLIWLNVVSCVWEVAEQVKKITSVLETKKEKTIDEGP
jgi:hypothetical protein